tara:strand:- start:8845 stop:9669 length:825 start_codon:yes stop_codon:yes gene_type:complete
LQPQPSLELRNVSKTFLAKSNAPIQAIANVDLAIQPGEFVTLVGPSGCGKSTLFNILAGLHDADADGEISFEGRQGRGRDLLGKVAFMPQRDLLLPWRRIIDNVILPLEIEGKTKRQARAEAVGLFGEFGLDGFERHYPHQLSGGMRQRVALMRTFMFKRSLMLLDEPFGALDALTRMLMQRWLLEVWENHNRTILFITHDVDEAIFLGDRVLVMSSRPGTIKMSKPVPLERPRTSAMLTAPEFLHIKEELLAAIEEESLKSFKFEMAARKSRV